ncbi:MAG TPA: hypothetical protein VMB71_14450 [Acetobacteraceae bacterium]|nr:hypothetical protein [Acetobacteraceae bacterium]
MDEGTCARDWLAKSLERSDAEILAGLAVPLEPVLERIRASIGRMKAATPTAEPRPAREA